MKKLFFSLFLFIILISVPLFVHGEGILYGGGFNFEDDLAFWSGGVLEESAAYSGENGYALLNPFGEEKNGLITHVLEYQGNVFLEAGHIYTLRGYVFDPCAENIPSLKAKASENEGSGVIIVNVSGAGYEWGEFVTTFYVSETKDYSLSLYFGEGNLYIGFFIDDLELIENPLILSSIEIKGQTKVLIPAAGFLKIKYSAQLYASDATPVGVLTSSALYLSANDCPGVHLNSSDFSITVTSDAQTGASVILNCMLANSSAVSPASITVTLTDNLILDSSFEENQYYNLWSGNSEINLYSDSEHGFFIGASTNDYNSYGFFTTIYYSVPQVLVEGTMYVLHADIRSDSPFESSPIYARNTAVNDDGMLTFNITDITSDSWQSVSAAFIPESSGIYNIAVTLSSRYDCTVFVDNIRLCAETPAPSYITLHAPGNISLPDKENTYSVSAYVRDQMGNIIDGAKCSITLLSDNDSVIFDSEKSALTVFPDSLEGEYNLRAVFNEDNELYTEITVTVSTDYIGDGSFEKKLVNEWWMVSSPYEYQFSINDNGSTKYAHIENGGSYFILLNNSYMYLTENTAYVFTAEINSSSAVTVTAFIEQSDLGALPLVQFSSDEALITELFLAEASSVGRLLLYIQSDNEDSFTINIDNITLKKAIVGASGAVMEGDFSVNGTAKAVFSFFNNVTKLSDTSACTVIWYMSDSPDGEYSQLSESGKYIYFDTEFANKYVYFEVTPICSVTGFSGSTVRSAAQFISAGSYAPEEDKDNTENDHSSSSGSAFSPVSLKEGAALHFEDINGHWCEKYVSLLAEAKVINGRSESVFDPDSSVTRCEFAKMLCLAFGASDKKTENVFTDVQSESWYAPYVLRLFAHGITNGISESLFAPDRQITREEAVVLLMRIYEKCGKAFKDPSSFEYYDDALISSWAKEYLYKATALGIAGGMPDNTIMPQRFTSRGEAAALICRMLEVF